MGRLERHPPFRFLNLSFSSKAAQCRKAALHPPSQRRKIRRRTVHQGVSRPRASTDQRTESRGKERYKGHKHRKREALREQQTKETEHQRHSDSSRKTGANRMKEKQMQGWCRCSWTKSLKENQTWQSHSPRANMWSELWKPWPNALA